MSAADPMPAATRAGFARDVARYRAEFERLGAVIDLGDEGKFVDPTMVPQELLDSYDRLRQYGYANGLLK